LEGRWSPQAFLCRSKHAPQRALSGGGCLFAIGRGGSGIAQRARCRLGYRRRTEEVCAAIPLERLLVFDVAEG
jgi:hypothetical protein